MNEKIKHISGWRASWLKLDDDEQYRFTQRTLDNHMTHVIYAHIHIFKVNNFLSLSLSHARFFISILHDRLALQVVLCSVYA